MENKNLTTRTKKHRTKKIIASLLISFLLASTTLPFTSSFHFVFLALSSLVPFLLLIFSSISHFQLLFIPFSSPDFPSYLLNFSVSRLLPFICSSSHSVFFSFSLLFLYKPFFRFLLFSSLIFSFSLSAPLVSSLAFLFFSSPPSLYAFPPFLSYPFSFISIQNK